MTPETWRAMSIADRDAMKHDRAAHRLAYLDREIPLVEAAIARHGKRLAEYSERFALGDWACCAACAFPGCLALEIKTERAEKHLERLKRKRRGEMRHVLISEQDRDKLTAILIERLPPGWKVRWWGYGWHQTLDVDMPPRGPMKASASFADLRRTHRGQQWRELLVSDVMERLHKTPRLSRWLTVEDGANAARRGEAITENPHEKFAKRWHAWMDGWMAIAKGAP